jgi:CRISPR/Cas system-associated endonuclease Cas1
MAPVVVSAQDILRRLLTRSGRKPSGLSGDASEEIKFAVIIIAVFRLLKRNTRNNSYASENTAFSANGIGRQAHELRKYLQHL